MRREARGAAAAAQQSHFETDRVGIRTRALRLKIAKRSHPPKTARHDCSAGKTVVYITCSSLCSQKNDPRARACWRLGAYAAHVPRTAHASCRTAPPPAQHVPTACFTPFTLDVL